MSAQRLISTLLLLQQRGSVTAAEVAAELEMSPRTARRDLEALAAAGVPVYSRAGRGGGWSLVGGARTDLSGLHADEARALFLVAGPAASASPEVKSALRKLVRAMPETFRTDAAAASAAIVIDPSQWGHPSRKVPEFLDAVRASVLDSWRTRIGYTDRRGVVSERVIDPYGVVDKRGVWYVVAGTDSGRRTFRIDRITSVTALDETFDRPADFDLERAWHEASSAFTNQWQRCVADLLVDAGTVHLLENKAGSAISVGELTGDGRRHVVLTAPAIQAAAVTLAGFGRQVEVVEPAELRAELAEIGRRLVERHG